ncbi:MAG: deoxyribonuclease V [Chloroflexales bacterium]|nr:deoxyribonuclease V [Chloroflexales bacterium]
MPTRGRRSATPTDGPEWPTTIDEAVRVQEELRGQVAIGDDFGDLRTVAGVDAGFEDAGATARAAVVVLSFPGLEPIEHILTRGPARFPYIPGFLSFREAPVILEALGQLRAPPDLVICDGQGIAHPRRLGIASHIGVLSGLPTIGCAKSLLVGRHGDLPDERGARVPLTYRKEQVGWALRTRPGVKPVYISPGHRVAIGTAADLVMACVTRYRLPETTRYAHNLASNGVIPRVKR